ncbi:MAG: glycosyltransferase [Candidatus Nanopelagicales bacterium]|nr:glycosyltransferase [Candidatus Nanopelagicales bacterium]
MPDRIRVLRLIARMNVGGPAVQVTGLMRHLDAERYDQRLVTGWCAPDEADYLLTQAPDVDVRRIDGLGRAVRPGDDLRVIATLRSAIRSFRPHIIHTHTAKAGMIGRAAAQLARTDARLVHTFHGHLLHGYFSPARTRALIELERLLARGTDRIVAVGPQVRDDLLAVRIGTPEKYVIIPPGLDFDAPPSRADARRELGIGDDAIVISLIGRLTGIKRADRFAEAAELVHRARPGVDLRFLVAGDGDTAAGLAETIRARDLPVTMLGWRSDIPVLLGATDVLALTSDNEGTPISLIQAAMAAVPVVATDVGSVRDVVLDGQTGLLAQTSAESVAAQILRLVDDPALRAAMGLRAQELAHGRYSAQRLAADHDALYTALLASRKTG